MKRLAIFFMTALFLLGFCLLSAGESEDQNNALFSYLKDREQEIPTSMFGTYINQGEFLVYPFFEYYHNHDQEYQPLDLGYGLDQDFRGKYRAFEGLIFLCYGLTRNISVEFEAAVIKATQEKSADDPTSMPTEITESGLGDVQMQINWLWSKETEKRLGFYSYAEVVFPTSSDKPLIGTSDWEIKLGTGLIRGFSWGTLRFRAAIEYSMEESKLDIGEIAIEYLKKLSRFWKFYVGVEGNQDEIELITEWQWYLSRNIFIKLNNAIGLTSKATDWAPEIGIMFRF